MMCPDHIHIDLRTCDLTLSQMMAEIDRLIREHPEQEIFMDGDAYAIVGRRRSMSSMTRIHAMGARS